MGVVTVLLSPLLIPIPILKEIQALFENQSCPNPCVRLVQDLCPSGFLVRTGVPLGLHLSLHLALHWQECRQPYAIRHRGWEQSSTEHDLTEGLSRRP